MSKGDGLKIGIRFTEKLTSDIGEQLGTTIGTVDVAKNRGISANNGTFANAFDGNDISYWYSSGATVWVIVDLITPTSIALVKLFSNGDGYWSKGCVIEGSTDGATWTSVFQNTYAMVRNVSFDLSMPSSIKYRYYKFTFTTQYGALVTTSLEIYPNLPYGNEKAFTVTGKECQYINGNLLDKTYTPISVEAHPTDPNSILLTMDWWNRFNNVEDKLKVLYDASKGSLTGAGGAVESFEIEFTPEDLIQTPNPNEEELIKAYPYEIVLDLKEVTYSNVYPQETIKAYPYEIVLELKHVSEINP